MNYIDVYLNKSYPELAAKNGVPYRWSNIIRKTLKNNLPSIGITMQEETALIPTCLNTNK